MNVGKFDIKNFISSYDFNILKKIWFIKKVVHKKVNFLLKFEKTTICLITSNIKKLFFMKI